MFYEHPINNKIRTWLRFTHSFERLHSMVHESSQQWDYHAFQQLFDLLDLSEQFDFRAEILMELDRFHQFLQMLADNPEVDHGQWEKLVKDINRTTMELRSAPNRPSFVLCTNPWVSTLRSRMHVAGGCNEFDMPSFHWWRHRLPEQKHNDLQDFQKLFAPYHHALSILLDSIRQTARIESYSMVAGNISFNLSAGATIVLLRVELPDDSPFFPEISANRHIVNIRMLELAEGSWETKQINKSGNLSVALCSMPNLTHELMQH